MHFTQYNVALSIPSGLEYLFKKFQAGYFHSVIVHRDQILNTNILTRDLREQITCLQVSVIDCPRYLT